MTDKISNWESMVMTEAEKVGNKFDNIELDCGTHAEAFGMGAGFAVKSLLSHMEAFCSRDGSDEFEPPRSVDAGTELSAWELFESVKEFLTR